MKRNYKNTTYPSPQLFLYYGVERGVKEIKINRLESEKKRVA